jgi:hypothetical protein
MLLLLLLLQPLYGKMFAGWVFTLFAAGGISALLFALGVYTPSKPETKQLVQMRQFAIKIANQSMIDLADQNLALATPDDYLLADINAQNFTLFYLDPKGNLDGNYWVSNDDLTREITNSLQLVRNHTVIKPAAPAAAP